MKIKRIVGMAVNGYGCVIAELDNGFYAMVPTFRTNENDLYSLPGEPVEYNGQPDYSYSFVSSTKWFPLIVNGYVPEEIFWLAMENFAKMFKESPLSQEEIEEFTKIRKNPIWSEEEKQGERYCRKKYDASGFKFKKTLDAIFSEGPIDPEGFPGW